jgi:hypothetical protein
VRRSVDKYGEIKTVKCSTDKELSTMKKKTQL